MRIFGGVIFDRVLSTSACANCTQPAQIRRHDGIGTSLTPGLSYSEDGMGGSPV